MPFESPCAALKKRLCGAGFNRALSRSPPSQYSNTKHLVRGASLCIQPSIRITFGWCKCVSVSISALHPSTPSADVEAT
jgi:hypothetical protein